MGRRWLYVLVLIVALVVLPTLTPEDFFTTAVLVAVLGFWGYLLLALLVLLLVFLVLPRRYRRKLF